ncbi:MAG: sterol desaturase family protein, partial [Pyrinomonadaceae bacterium]
MNLRKGLRLLSVPAAFGALGVLLILERRLPLRRTVEDTRDRTIRNIAIAGAAAAALMLSEKPVAARLTRVVEGHRIGLLKFLPLPRAVETAAAVILLDYTLYLWHVITHRVPLLWRFHAVHHADLDLDASTAIRFHFGELIISVIWRAAQIVVIGVSPSSLRT